VKNFHANEKVSKSLYTLQTKYNGVQGVCQSLHTNSKNGISGTKADIDARTKSFGANKSKEREIKSVFSMLLEPFEDNIMKILVAAAIVSLICGYIQHGLFGLIEGFSIIMSICIIVCVTAANDYAKEKQFQKLMSREDQF